ncbi:NapC/NirT family cytochrome c [Ciceribacter ferrooxidans]|uniref:Cytochrome c-type protein n=1 Tax=Ciceribacter ferrooxidans TaxID=2509717 RepID=A0A4Q2T4A5_9HYPH|nr:NapC/NirT family cytochrome c [Ciceribacter ferrooxidans]RYC11880.1 Denitrification system component NirT [Ciceribacter ferrooxidans]
MLGLLRRFWGWYARPPVMIGQGILLTIGLIAGVVFWGGFHTAMEATNSLAFCTSCHEMRDTVYVEYQQSVHYRNASGVRAICSDCHVPHEWGPKTLRKIQAAGEIWSKVTGKIDTPEKFEARRLELATHVWKTMKDSDSRECRNCHSFDAMDFAHQRPRAREKMEPVATGKYLGDGSTCIDCHKGIAHRLPKVERDD